jgi:RNA polymerase sigma-70 factor (ECF subfamily)
MCALPEHDAAVGARLGALAARAQLGDRPALEALLRELATPLHEHVRGIVRDPDDAADVLQETLLLVCRRLATLREHRWVRAWAYRIATREAVRAARRGRAPRTLSIDTLPDFPIAIDEPVVDPELVAELPRRLDSLPAAAQTVLRMRYLHGLSQSEIAEALEIPIGTVKSRIAYGLDVLRRTWTR